MQLSCFKNFTDTAPYASTLENVVGCMRRDLGFRGLRYQGVRGYLAKMRNCDEITRIQHIMAHDADADT